MLVLSRKVDEILRIGEDIEITVVSISGDTVRLGIQAPKDVKILRAEVYSEIQRQNLAASVGSAIPDVLEAIVKQQQKQG